MVWVGQIGSPATVEIDFGSTPVLRGSFTITDSAITATCVMQVWQCLGPYTGKGSDTDEGELDPIRICNVQPTSGSATVRWELEEQPSLTRGADGEDPNTTMAIKSRVKGNFKFYYVVMKES